MKPQPILLVTRPVFLLPLLLAAVMACFGLPESARAANPTLIDIGSSAPTPGLYDQSQLIIGTDTDYLNYFFDNIPAPGQTFTTGGNSGGYILNTLSLATAGQGGSFPAQGQAYTLYVYSVSGSNATLLTSYTSQNTFTFAETDWLQWTNLGLTLSPNTKYAYAFQRNTQGYEQMSSVCCNPYSGGEMCLIPTNGGSITFGADHNRSASFDIGLTALGTPPKLIDIGATAPTPGPNDQSQLTTGTDDDYLNYFFDNNPPPGQTFTTGGNSGGYILNTLSLATAGQGGNFPPQGQAFTLYIYSVSGSNATLLTSYTSQNNFIFTETDWLQWTNLGLALSPNTQYAYAFRANFQGYEQMSSVCCNPYSGGEIGLIPTSGGTITFGADHNRSASFNIGLTLVGTTAPNPVIAVNAGHASITLTNGTVGLHYQIDYAASLSSSNAWQLLQDIPSLPTIPYTVNDPTSIPQNLSRFYRVVLKN